MGGKKRNKAQSTDTSGTDLDTSETCLTAEQRRSQEVSDRLMDKLKKLLKKKIVNSKLFKKKNSKIVEEVEKLRSEVFELRRLNDRLVERLQKSESKCAELEENVILLRNRLED